MEQKKISVCMAVYNGQKYITEQLLSIYNQSREADEVVICDDKSTDNTVEIVKTFIAEHNLEGKWRLYCNENTKGYPGNFYYAMGLCSGDLVFPSDQDDVWEVDKIEKMSQVMCTDETILVLSSAWQVIDRDGKIVGKSTDRNDDGSNIERISVEQIYYKYLWPGMTMCYRQEFGRRVVEMAGGTKLAHDVALVLCAAEEDGFGYMNCCLQYHRNHGENVAIEEHRIWKILNKKRKLLEIRRYLAMLQEIVNNPAMEGKYKDLAVKKQKIMQERLENLEKGKLFRMIKQYWLNREMIRISTVICDCLICFGKADTAV